VLFAPSLPNLEAIRIVSNELSKPLNVVMGLSGPTFTVEDLQEAGVKRISVGGSFARAALGTLFQAAKEVKTFGTFNYAREALPHTKAMEFMDNSIREADEKIASDQAFSQQI